MKGARESYAEAEAALLEARQRAVELQERFKVLSSDVEVSLITGQISALEGELTSDRLSLAQMESNASPNQSRVEPLKRRIATMEQEVAALRAKLVEEDDSGQSLARVQSELAVAEADSETRQMMPGAGAPVHGNRTDRGEPSGPLHLALRGARRAGRSRYPRASRIRWWR